MIWTKAIPSKQHLRRDIHHAVEHLTDAHWPEYGHQQTMSDTPSLASTLIDLRLEGKYMVYLFARVGCEQPIPSQSPHFIEGSIDGLFKPFAIAAVVYRIVRGHDNDLATAAWKVELIYLAINVGKPLKRTWRVVWIDLREVADEQMWRWLWNGKRF